MKFSDIVGQKSLIDKLRKNIESGRVAHAQLFEGDTGFGSLALALAYIQYLNCTNRTNGDSCGTCPSCVKIASLQHPDLNFVFPVNKSDEAVNLSKNSQAVSDNFIALWRKFALSCSPQMYFTPSQWYSAIKLNSKTIQPMINKREADLILEKLVLRPIDSKYSMFIIWLPEKMNEAAANTLLKQFEEPVGNSLFIFVTEDSSKIIKTILSRTQQTKIPPITLSELEKYILDKYSNLTQQDATTLARVSEGSIIKLEKSLNSDQSSELWFEVFKDLMRNCYLNKHLKLLSWVDDYVELPRDESEKFFVNSIEVLRYSYLQNMGVGELNISLNSQRDFISKFFPYINSSNIEQLIEQFERAAFHLSRNGNAKIVMTHFALSVTKLVNPLKK